MKRKKNREYSTYRFTMIAVECEGNINKEPSVTKAKDVANMRPWAKVKFSEIGL